MRCLRIGLFFLAGIFAVLITVLLTVLLMVDFGRFKDRIKYEVTELLGRELRIDGVLHLTLGVSIELYVEDLYLANPEWAAEDALVTARKIDIAIDTWSLISGPIEFERIETDGIRVNLEKNESGDASWSFPALATRPDAAPADDAPVDHLPVMLDYAAINDTQLWYQSSSMAQPLLFVAESLVATIDGGNLNVSLTGSLNGTPLYFENTSGSIEKLLEYRDITVDLKGNIGDIDIRGFALLDNLLSPRRPQLKLEIDGPSAQYLTDILLMPPISQGPLELSISIGESGEHMVASLEGIFGEFNFSVDGLFQDIQELNDIHLNVAAGGPDIGAIIRLTGREYDESDPFSISGKILRSGPEVTIEDVLVSIGESRLTIEGFLADFPTANGANLSLIASGPDFGRFNRLLGMPGHLGGAFTTSLKLVPQADGRTLVELNADAEHIRILLHSVLSPSEKFADSTLQLSISGADVGVIAEAVGYAGLPSEEFNITGSVEKDRDGYRLQNVRALFGDDLLLIDGHIGDKPFAGETDFEIRLSGSDLGSSVIALGGSAENLPKGAYHLVGKMQKQDDKLWLRDIEAVIGDHEQYKLGLSGFLTIGQAFRDSQLAVHAKGTSLAALAELLRLEGVPDFPFEIRADVRRGTSNTYFENGFFGSGIVTVGFAGYVGDKPLEDDLEFSFDADVPRMKDVIAQFGIAVEQIPAGDLVASGTLRNNSGRMSLERFVASFEGAKLIAGGRIGQLPTLDGTSITLALSGNDLSRLLPPEMSGDSLAHDYSVEGRVRLKGGLLEVDRLQARLGHTSARGELRFALDPVLGSGDFSLRADSPDLFQLWPELKDVSIPKLAKMKLRGSGNWSDNYWNFDDVRLELGKATMTLSGRLDGPPSFDRTDLNIELQASSVRNISVLVGRELPDHPLHLTARLVGTKDVMTMEGFALRFGHSDLQGDFSMRSGDVPAVKIDVTSSLFDIAGYAAQADDEDAEPPAAKEKKKNQKVIPDTPLPLELLRSFDADIAVEIDELRTRVLNEKGVKVKALVADGALKIERLSVIGPRGGHLNLSADLVPNDTGGADFKLTADGSEQVLGFAAKTEQDLQQLPLFELRAELAANGATIRELAGSLDGYIRLVGGTGRIKSGAFSLFTQDFVTEVINAVNPFAKKDPYTNVKCEVILLKFEDGRVVGKPALVQQTEKLRIFASTEINLKTEKLRADFKMVPQKGLGLSISSLVNPYVQVSGTLANPTLNLDPQSILIEGGVAVATGGLSILAKGFKDRFLSGKDPCAKAVKDFDTGLKALY